MKELLCTCPFTGVKFKALESTDGNVYFIHPLTGAKLQMKIDRMDNTYQIPMEYFTYMKTVTPSKAGEILDVSKQRISQIVADNTIPVRLVNGSPVFLLSDVAHYKDTRKVGAPRKEDK